MSKEVEALQAAKEAEIAALDAEDAKAEQAQMQNSEAAPVQPEVKPEEPVSVEPEQQEPERVERKVFNMPVDKHLKQVENLKEKHEQELKDREAQLRAEYDEKLKSVQPQLDDKELEQFAETNGLDANAIKGLAQVLEKRIGKPAPIPEEWSQKISKIDEYEREKDIMKAQRAVQDEFDRVIVPKVLDMYPDVTQEHLQIIKKDIEHLAFTQQYNSYPIDHIFRVNLDKYAFKSKAGAESSRGGSSIGSVDFSKVTDADIKRMSPKEAESYFAWEDQKGASQSRYKS